MRVHYVRTQLAYKLRYFGSKHQIKSQFYKKIQARKNLGDMLSAAGVCKRSTTTRVKTARNRFKELLPVICSPHLSFKTRGRVYSSCLRSAMLNSSVTWPLTKPNLQHLQRNDRAMIRQICNVKPQDIVTIRSNELLAQLGIEDLDLILKKAPLVWTRGMFQRCSQDSL